MNEIIKCAAYSAGRRIAEVELNQVHEVLKGANQFVWIGLHEPSEEVLCKVQDEFGLHDLAVEDAHHAHQRPKVELYGECVFVVLRTAGINKKLDTEFGETHLFVGPNFIVTVRHGSSIPYAEVRARCESVPHLLRKGHGFALYSIMDFIVDRFYPVVHEMELELQAIEDQIFKVKPDRSTTERIYELKRELLEVKRAVSPLVDVCNRLMRLEMQWLSEDTRPYFRDVLDHVVRINEMVDHTRELLNTAMEANFSLISISQNDISKRFAGWAAIIALPTMIAGFYGMNFEFMPETDSQYGFYFVIGFTAVACSLLFLLFKRSGWL